MVIYWGMTPKAQAAWDREKLASPQVQANVAGAKQLYGDDSPWMARMIEQAEATGRPVDAIIYSYLVSQVSAGR